MSIDVSAILNGELSGWTAVNELGSGGFKSVHLIRRGLAQEALKVTRYFDPALQSVMGTEEIEDLFRSRTEREYCLLSAFGGGGVVALGAIPLHERTWEGHPLGIYSEEFIPGCTLSEEMARRRTMRSQAPGETVRIVFGTGIDVIERLWARGVVHRDIKPLNIMITGMPGRPVVFLDLGIAFDRMGVSLTAQTLGPGTLRYRAPETLDPDYRATIDFRCDLFSLAATVYEYAAGFHPIHHGSSSDGETVYRLLKRNAAPLADHRPDLGSAFCSLVDRCLHKKPALRPNRIQTIRSALEGTT